MKILLKKILSYEIWINLLSFYQFINFKFFKKYTARGSIDKKLIEILQEKKNGSYLEIGAYNGISESVSLRLENELGWNGILIEPNPQHFKFLKRNRKKNLCLNFICLDETFLDKDLYIKNLNQMSYVVDRNNKFYFNNYPKEEIDNLARKSYSGNFKTYKCKVNTLNNIFKEYNILKLDLAIIDVEGSELQLLNGIDFNSVYISFFCIESYDFDKLYKFMENKNFVFVDEINKNDFVFKNKK